MADSPVRVLVVRPGFVTTRMTQGLKPAPFATTPDAVAQATVNGLAGTSTGSVVRVARTATAPGQQSVQQDNQSTAATVTVTIQVSLPAAAPLTSG